MSMRMFDYSGSFFHTWRIAAAMSIVGLAVLLNPWNSRICYAAVSEIVILKSSEIAAYDDAVKGFKATAPSGAIYREYDMRGDLAYGKEITRKIRGSGASLIVAVGLKAALAAKQEIGDVPIVFMKNLEPQEQQLNGTNITGTILEDPPGRQAKTPPNFLPTKHKLGIL